jgi:predicted AlkP superfamily phosphohydrolase/phosphomutase
MSAPRLLLIGWDAADRRTVEAWAADGTLPNLADLRRRGRHGRIASLPGLGDDAAWSSFATGTEPGEHGRFHHRQLVPGSYRVDNFHRDRMTGEPFWTHLGDAGRRVAVLDVPKSPLATRVNGIQLADWLPHGEDGPTPIGSADAIAMASSERFRVPSGFSCHHARTGTAELAALRDRVRSHLDLRTELASTWLRAEPWDLFLAVFAESHCIGHHCWHLHDLAHPAHDAAAGTALGDPVRDVYARLDTALGALLAQCGPETVVIVFSLLGMGTTFVASTQLVDAVLHRLDAGTNGDGRRRRSQRVWARLRGRPIPEVAERNAFAVHTNSIASGVRVNLVGRDPYGRIRPEAYDDYCRTLATGFMALEDPATGRRLVRDVVRVADRYAGPRSSTFADLLVVWDARAPIMAVASDAIGVVDGGPAADPPGNHVAGGWFVAAGPGIAPGAAEGAMPIVDVGPTVAALLGVELPRAAGAPFRLA